MDLKFEPTSLVKDSGGVYETTGPITWNHFCWVLLDTVCVYLHACYSHTPGHWSLERDNRGWLQVSTQCITFQTHTQAPTQIPGGKHPLAVVRENKHWRHINRTSSKSSLNDPASLVKTPNPCLSDAMLHSACCLLFTVAKNQL